MKRFVRFVATAALGLLFVTLAAADTLELKDGRVLQGRYLGGTQAVLRFEVDGNVQTFGVNDVVAVTFTHATRWLLRRRPRLLRLSHPRRLLRRNPYLLAAQLRYPPGKAFWSA